MPPLRLQDDVDLVIGNCKERQLVMGDCPLYIHVHLQSLMQSCRSLQSLLIYSACKGRSLRGELVPNSAQWLPPILYSLAQ